MTSPYYPSQGFGDPQFDRDQASRMWDLQTQMKVKELEQQYKLGKSEVDARLKIAGQESKDRRYGIDAQRDSEREKLGYMREEMERVGIPRMLIEKYVAEKTYEIALSEMTLKRDVFVEETAQAREKLKLEREEMERIGIPDMEIRRYVAQQEAAIARGQLGLGEGELTGYYNGQSTLSRDQFASDAEYQRAQLAQQQRQFETTASGYLPSGAGGPGQATLDRERFQQDQLEQARRYGLDVSKFGADLASTPDTYFQARRFQGVDVPRLLGGAGAVTNDVQGGPTPGVGTMGAYLSGQDPYGPPAPPAAPIAIPAAQGAPPAAPATAPLSVQEQARFEQLLARQQQTGGSLDPVDADELQRFVQRGARAPTPIRATPPGQVGTTDPTRTGGYLGQPGAGPGGMTTGWYDPTGQYGAGAGGGDENRMIGITDPGFDPNAAQRKIGMAGGYGAVGGSYEALKAAGGGYGDPTGFTGAAMRSSAPTASVYGGPAVSASVGPQGYAMPSWYTQQQRGSSPYPSQDPRQKQLAALAKALPPSPFDGLGEEDTAALRAMEAIYKKGFHQIQGGELERLQSSGRMGFLKSAGKLLGYSPDEEIARYQSYRPSQGSSRMAG